MAFRSAERNLVLPIDAGWVHDGWFALLISAVARVAALTEPLVEYRQHDGQQIGARREGLFEKVRRANSGGADEPARVAAAYAAARDRLGAFRSRLHEPRALELLDEKTSHLEARARIHGRTGRRLPTIVRELLLGRYARFSPGWKSVVRDLAFP